MEARGIDGISEALLFGTECKTKDVSGLAPNSEKKTFHNINKNNVLGDRPIGVLRCARQWIELLCAALLLPTMRRVVRTSQRWFQGWRPHRHFSHAWRTWHTRRDRRVLCTSQGREKVRHRRGRVPVLSHQLLLCTTVELAGGEHHHGERTPGVWMCSCEIVATTATDCASPTKRSDEPVETYSSELPLQSVYTTNFCVPKRSDAHLPSLPATASSLCVHTGDPQILRRRARSIPPYF